MAKKLKAIAGNIELGDLVRLKTNGFEGIATEYLCHMTSCNQFILTPRVQPEAGKKLVHEAVHDNGREGELLAKDPLTNKPGAAYKRSVMERVPNHLQPRLGDQVKSDMSGATLGILSVIRYSLDGTVWGFVKPMTPVYEGKADEGHYYPMHELIREKVDPLGLIDPETVAKTPEAEPIKKKPGGTNDAFNAFCAMQ